LLAAGINANQIKTTDFFKYSFEKLGIKMPANIYQHLELNSVLIKNKIK
jgi:hypothetical protein